MTLSFYPILSIVVIASFYSSCSSDKYTYDAVRQDGEIIIDGDASEANWSNAEILENFVYPWQDLDPPKTTFRAMHDDDNLYFYYHADDEDIRLKETGDEEMDAVESDRVEIFIKGADDASPYYALEMDPLGRVFDSKAEFGDYIDHEYDFPNNGLTFKGKVYHDHYTLEGKIALDILRELDLISSDGTIFIGLYRGEYYVDKNGEEKTNWISWVIPDSATPNFHIPSSFGMMRMR